MTYHGDYINNDGDKGARIRFVKGTYRGEFGWKDARKGTTPKMIYVIVEASECRSKELKTRVMKTSVQEVVSEVTISQEVHAQTRQEQRTISPASAGVRPPQTISVPRPRHPRFQQGGPRSVSPEPEYEQGIVRNYPSPQQEVLPDAPALRRVLTNSTAATTAVASVTPPRTRRSPSTVVQENPANYLCPRQESSTRRTRSTRRSSGRRNTTATASEPAPPPAVSARQTELVTNMLRDNPEVEQWMDQVAEMIAASAPDTNFANERDHLTALLTLQARKIQQATSSSRRRRQHEENDHSIVSSSHDTQAPAVVQVESGAEEEEEDLASMDSDLMYDWQDAVTVDD